MSLQRRLTAVEREVESLVGSTEAEPSPLEVRRLAAWRAALGTVLTHMPPARAHAVVAELQAELEWEDQSPITRRVVPLANSTVPAWYPNGGRECAFPYCGCAFHYDHHWGALALPESVCAVLDAHPEARFETFNCASCGYASGEMDLGAWQQYQVAHPQARATDRAYFAQCPICGGGVAPYGFQVARHYSGLYERSEP